ncbi:MAG TPA: hypothetical protein VGC18_13915 [Lacisediminihabitans sp.]|uniref:hypothetical protein n=1 Tax=Lacisediminihabitans sp. TaxID=2787631 RepID=UPI002ED8416E
MTDQTPAQPDGATTVSEVLIRRAPKYSVFMVLGALLGAIVTFIVTASFPVDPAVGFGALFGYFLLYGVPAGVVLGGVVAILLDRLSTHRAKTITAERTVVDPPPVEGELED